MDNVAVGRMNDLWRYDIAANQWTWMSGSNISGQAGVYGVRGTASTSNTPGARRGNGSVAATDSAGNFWLFGGDATGSSMRENDLWKYNPTTNEWTWVSGSNTSNQVGVYGTKLVANPANVPGARQLQSTAVGKGDEIWIVNGYNGNEFGDFWAYSKVTDQWTWLSGSSASNPSASYGTLGVTIPTNTPGGRDGSFHWVDSKGNLWLYGGGTNKASGDLWKAIRY
jgi:hypothetical protein